MEEEVLQKGLIDIVGLVMIVAINLTGKKKVFEISLDEASDIVIG